MIGIASMRNKSPTRIATKSMVAALRTALPISVSIKTRRRGSFGRALLADIAVRMR